MNNEEKEKIDFDTYFENNDELMEFASKPLGWHLPLNAISYVNELSKKDGTRFQGKLIHMIFYHSKIKELKEKTEEIFSKWKKSTEENEILKRKINELNDLVNILKLQKDIESSDEEEHKHINKKRLKSGIIRYYVYLSYDKKTLQGKFNTLEEAIKCRDDIFEKMKEQNES